MAVDGLTDRAVLAATDRFFAARRSLKDSPHTTAASWGNNLTKRVTGRPKVVLLDTGLAARLINVTPAALAPGVVSQAAGGLFEAFVVAELCRQRGWSQTRPELFHFRDRDGLEVDIVLEDPDRRIAGIEVKAASTVTTADFRGLVFLRDKLGIRFRAGILLHTGPRPLPFGDRLYALPRSGLWSGPTTPGTCLC